MYRAFSIIWDRLRQAWKVVGENARARGKQKERHSRLTRGLSTASMLSLLAPVAAFANNLPSQGSISHGRADISVNGADMHIQQHSHQLIANWQNFSIGENNSVTFSQPGADSVALNRVLGQDPSRILGNLNANGQVFLLNPNGVVIGQNASVQTGAFVASTLGLRDEDFLAGHYQFNGDSNAAILNQGDLQGAVVALISPMVSNEGTIVGAAADATAPGVALAAGTDVLLDFDGDGLLSVEVKASTLQTLVQNQGLIQADGGLAILTAKGASDALKGVVNNSGTVQAQTLARQNGRILLLGDMQHGEVNVAGTLDASAPNGGDGGFIDTSAAQVAIANEVQVTTAAAQGETGTWLIDPTDFTVSAGNAAQTDSGIGAETLNNNLASTSVTLQTVAEGSEAGDINVNADISYSRYRLTLNAHNDINLNANIHVKGSGTLALNYGGTAGDSAATPAEGSGLNALGGQVNFEYWGSDLLSINGTGYKVIWNVEGLQDIRNDLDGHYALGRDINARTTASWNSGAGFEPLGGLSNSFTGTFDGLGHTIQSLTISRPEGSSSYAGLFGSTYNATLRNVGLVGGSVSGYWDVGGLVGYQDGGSITHAYTASSVWGGDSVGGLVGRQSGGSIAHAYATGSVTGERWVGGLVGEQRNDGSIEHAYTTGSVRGKVSSVGGLVGAQRNGSIKNAYATGRVSRYDEIFGGLAEDFQDGSLGGLVGYQGGGSITDSFWNIQTTGQSVGFGTFDSFWNPSTTGQNVGVGTSDSSVGAPMGLNTAEMFDAASFSGFDFNNVWGNADGQTTPYLLGLADNQVFNKNDLPDNIDNSNRPALYKVIQNVDQLQAINRNLAGRYVLGNNIDASVTANWNPGDHDNDSVTPDEAMGFDPLGGYSNSFTGTFDGQGYSIDGLTINRPDKFYVGLFGYTENATLRNVGLIDGRMSGDTFVGGLVGYQNGGSIAHTYATGSVTGDGSVGGLVGWGDGSIAHAYTTGSVTGDGSVGGLVGFQGDGSIEHVYATGNVSGNEYVGGLVGQQSYDGSIAHAYATGSVEGTGYYVGGLVGYQNSGGSIAHAYATGNVSGDWYVGGLVGYQDGGNIKHAYATGSMSEGSRVGGLVGYQDGGISHSFYATTDASGNLINEGLNVAGFEQGTITDSSGKRWDALTTLTTFTDAGWDIDGEGGTGSVWRLYEGHSTPLLRSFLTPLELLPDYDGSGAALDNIAQVTLPTDIDSSLIGNWDDFEQGDTLTLSGNADGEGYTASSHGSGIDDLYSYQNGYDIITSRNISTPGSAAGEVQLPDALTWNSGHLLIDTSGAVTTLGASNGANTTAIDGDVFTLASGNWTQNSETLADFTVKDFRFDPANATFLRVLGGDGSEGNAYQISDIYGLQGIGSHDLLASHSELVNDIDASATATWNLGDHDNDPDTPDEAMGFDPLGEFPSNSFTGTFDGQGHSIHDLVINRPNEYDVGLFGRTDNATLRNVGLVGGSVSGRDYVGGLVGWQVGDDSIAHAYVTGSVSGNYSVGGLVAWWAGRVMVAVLRMPIPRAACRGMSTLAAWWVGSLVTSAKASMPPQMERAIPSTLVAMSMVPPNPWRIYSSLRRLLPGKMRSVPKAASNLCGASMKATPLPYCAAS